MQLILASASPRRADLLRAAGYTFETLAVDVDERPHDGEPPGRYVARLAHEKSAAAMQRLLSRSQRACRGPERGAATDAIVLGADTTVVIDGEILGKPHDDAEGAAMLRKLSGRRHEVLTGVSVLTSTAERVHVESTSVYMMELTADDVAWYVASGEGRDKAGGYAVQGLASRFIPRIDGSYSNVVGLPVASLDALLREVVRAG